MTPIAPASGGQIAHSPGLVVSPRIEETFAIEAALESVAPGASVAGTAGLLLDMHEQLAEREAYARDHATTLHAEAIARHLAESGGQMAAMAEQLRQVMALLKAGR